jgi:hypothetical protein
MTEDAAFDFSGFYSLRFVQPDGSTPYEEEWTEWDGSRWLYRMSGRGDGIAERIGRVLSQEEIALHNRIAVWLAENGGDPCDVR